MLACSCVSKSLAQHIYGSSLLRRAGAAQSIKMKAQAERLRSFLHKTNYGDHFNRVDDSIVSILLGISTQVSEHQDCLDPLQITNPEHRNSSPLCFKTLVTYQV